MTRDSVAATVEQAFADVVGQPPPFGPRTHPDHLDTWDSLIHVMLVHELESRLGVSLPEDVLTARMTLGELVDAACSAVTS